MNKAMLFFCWLQLLLSSLYLGGMYVYIARLYVYTRSHIYMYIYIYIYIDIICTNSRYEYLDLSHHSGNCSPSVI